MQPQFFISIHWVVYLFPWWQPESTSGWMYLWCESSTQPNESSGLVASQWILIEESWLHDNYAHHKTLYMHLAYSYALMNKVLSFAHSTVLHINDDPCLPCSETHNITHSPCTSKCTTHPPLPTPLPSTTLLCTQLTNTKHICISGGKMAQGVGMVWKGCGVIPI